MIARQHRPARFRRDSVLLRIPASTSNLGSGFDTLGLALNLYQYIQLTRIAPLQTRHVDGSPESVDLPTREIVKAAARAFFKHTRRKRFGVQIEQWGEVPVARGLGASALLRVGVVAGLNEPAGTGLSRTDLVTLVTRLEGHPDNASPAMLGGFTVSGQVDGRIRCLSFPVNTGLRFVTLIPDFGIDTAKARRLLPTSYPCHDASHALSRAALVTAAFSSEEYDALRGVFDDRMHQPYREPLVPKLRPVIQAGERAGAIGGFLSGSGSAIICVTRKQSKAFAHAMHLQMRSATVKILSADNDGFTVATSSLT